jgi:hypothetical protein
VVLSFIMLATAGHVSNRLGVAWTQVYGGVGLSIFNGVCGLLTAALYLATPYIATRVENAHTRKLQT